MATKKNIRVKDLIATLQMFEPEAQMFCANDEELNSVYWGFEVAQLETKEKVVIYPLSGQEEEESYEADSGEVWCDCPEKDKERCSMGCEFRGNGECACGVYKHHYHGGVCGKITQIG